MAKGKDWPYGKGRRRIADVSGGGSYGEKWYEKLEYLDTPKKGSHKEIRIVGGIFTIFQHFVRFKRKDGSKGGFYELCPNWDPAAHEFRRGPDATCPICADFQSEDLPAELRLLGSFRYYMDAFDVTAAKAGKTDGLYGVVFTNKYGIKDLQLIAEISGYDVDDLENGGTVLWHYNEKATDPKDRVRFNNGAKLPINWDEERKLFVLKKKFTGSPTDFESIVEVKPPDRIRDDLKRLGLYQQLEEVLDVLAARTGDVRRGPRTSDEDLSSSSSTDWGDEEEDEKPQQEKRRRGRPPKSDAQKSKPKPKPKEEEEEDENWGEEDSGEGWGEEEEDPPKKSSKQVGKKNKKEETEEDESWGEEAGDDGDGWGEEDSSDDSFDDGTGGWNDEEEEAESEPAPRKRGRPPKAEGGKKKKPAPEPEEEEDDSEEW